ncbi:hypothetical protein I1E95_02955 [Synechococcus sp. CBW1107]|jgi:hypothetical protein|uniref:hypothetical protein n=1 Tax=Synechococcus sp. CBW1107 TaxID=2789857 RepID=UPI0018CF63FC|nr:hypothetical protein [Synechococcus sp. CBW1107]QPN57132.1 hypothetical protein I1E95_02955 [Synechococcus sp. CBW1107]CAK6694175.1 hypothetical protein BBFGKLBO_01591 [Synechococcus sp. CBW1107]
MGELVGGTSGITAELQSGYALVSAVISVLALGLFALFQNDQENNDDDDSNPGGGLMQPVA